jgi:DNA-binding protein H-NS
LVASAVVLTDETRRKLQAAGRKQQKATEERDRLIAEAVEAGGSLREVGNAVGLSHMAVKYIAKGRPKK